MTRDQLLDALLRLLPAQLDIVLFRVNASLGYPLGPPATPAWRITELLRWAEQQNRTADMERIYLEVAGGSPATPPPTPGASVGASVTMPTVPSVPAAPPALAASSTSAVSGLHALTVSFPLPLLDAYRKNTLAVLFGSGVSMAKDVVGSFPKWTELPERFLEQVARYGLLSQEQINAKRMFFQPGGYVSLEQMLSELDALKAPLRSARKYQAALNSIFRPTNAAPGDVHHALVEFDVPVLVTTNYDHLLERAEGPERAPYTWKDADKALSDIEDGRKVLFKIHGSAEHEDTIVMTRAEYDRAAVHVPYQRAMSFLLQSYTFLIVGYGINDPLDLDLIFGLNTSAFGSAGRTHYALMKDASTTDRGRWQRDMNVQIIEYKDHGDLPAILRSLRATKHMARPTGQQGSERSTPEVHVAGAGAPAARRPSVQIVGKDAIRDEVLLRLASDLFASLGYTEPDVRRIRGTMVYLTAVHRIEQRAIFALCSASEAPVDEDDVVAFLTTFQEDSALPEERVAYMVSLKGYTARALRRAQPTAGRGPVVLDGSDVVDELVRHRVLSSHDVAVAAARRLGGSSFDGDPEAQVIGHESGWIWAVVSRTHVALVHADGTALSKASASRVLDDGGPFDSLIPLLPPDPVPAHQRIMDEARRRYFQVLAAECSTIQLDGLPADGDVRTRELRLEQLFIPTRLRPQSAERAPTLPSVQTFDAKARYVSTWIVRSFARILVGYERRAPFTTIRTTAQESARVTGVGGPAAVITPDSWIQNFVHPSEAHVGRVLSKFRHIAILAPPGGGKSTLIKWIAGSLAAPIEQRPESWDLPADVALPLLVRCRELGPKCRQPLRRTLCQLAETAGVEDVRAGFDQLVEEELRSGRVLVLLDGLDEIADDGDRRVLVEHVRTFLSIYPHAYLIVTSREPGYRAVAGILGGRCHTYHVAPFTDEDVRRLVVAWHRELAGSQRNVSQSANDLATTICDNNRIRALAGNPLLLTTLLLVERWLGQLPTKRSILYGKAVEVLLQTWNVQAHAPIDLDEVIPQLSFIAFSMMTARQQQISERELKRLLREAREHMPDLLAYARTSVADFVRRVELRSSLLIQSGHTEEDGSLVPLYEFRHLTFQEYLAAWAVAHQHLPSTAGESPAEILAPCLGDDWWKEVVLLVAVLANRRQVPELVGELIRQVRCAAATDRELEERLADTLARLLEDEVKVSPELLEDALAAIAEVTLARDGLWYGAAALGAGRHGPALLRAAGRLFLEQASGRDPSFDRLGDIAGIVERVSRAAPDALPVANSPSEEASAETLVANLASLHQRWLPRPIEAYGYRISIPADPVAEHLASQGASKSDAVSWCAKKNWSGLARSGLRPADAHGILTKVIRAWRDGGDTALSGGDNLMVLSALACRGEPGEGAPLVASIPGLPDFLSERAGSQDPHEALAALLIGYLTGEPWSRERLVEALRQVAERMSGSERDSWNQLCMLDRVMSQLGAGSVLPNRLHAVCLRNVSVFPGVQISFDIGRERSVAAVEEVAETPNPLLLLVRQRDPQQDLPGAGDCFEIGTIGRLVNVIKHTSGNYSAVVEGLHRVRVTRWIQEDPSVVAEIEPVVVTANDGALGEEIGRCMRLLGSLGESTAQGMNVAAIPGLLADLTAGSLGVEGQSLLPLLDGAERLRQVNVLLDTLANNRVPEDAAPAETLDVLIP